MKTIPQSGYLSIMLVLLLTGIHTTSYAQQQMPNQEQKQNIDSFDIKQGSFLLPLPLQQGKYYHSFSVLYVVPPRDWTADIINAPMLSYAGKYTLPYGFNIQGSFSTLIISNRILLGPYWNYSVNNYHFGAGYQVAFNVGVLNQFGFHTWLTGWEQQPSITAGYSFKTMAVILRGDLYWTTAFYVSEGKYVIPYTTSFINGYSISANLEQRLYKNKVMSFGLKMYYVRYQIIAWPAFPVNNYRYWVPEFQLGINF
jgi:hypothetical protein